MKSGTKLLFQLALFGVTLAGSHSCKEKEIESVVAGDLLGKYIVFGKEGSSIPLGVISFNGDESSSVTAQMAGIDFNENRSVVIEKVGSNRHTCFFDLGASRILKLVLSKQGSTLVLSEILLNEQTVAQAQMYALEGLPDFAEAEFSAETSGDLLTFRRQMVWFPGLVQNINVNLRYVLLPQSVGWKRETGVLMGVVIPEGKRWENMDGPLMLVQKRGEGRADVYFPLR